MTLPSPALLGAQYQEFVGDLKTSIDTFLDASRADPDLKGAFKSATAAYASFAAFGSDGNSLLRAASGIARRSLVLAVVRQLSLARVELRRLIECTVWYVYFIDHPVEWADFLANPGRSWADRPQEPIAAAASANVGRFFAYAKERLARDDPSKIGKAAIDLLHTRYGNLSGEVHAAMGAVHPTGNLALAFDRYDSASVGKLRREMHQVFASSLVTCASINPILISRLGAVERGFFDWLVSAGIAKVVRGGTFGVSR